MTHQERDTSLAALSRRRESSQPAALRVGVRLSAVVWAFPAYFALSALPTRGRSISFCLLQRFAGVPCPGCGITTGIRALLHGDVALAWTCNPSTLFVALFYLAHLFGSLALSLQILQPEDWARLVRTSDRLLFVAVMSAWSFHTLIPRFL